MIIGMGEEAEKRSPDGYGKGSLDQGSFLEIFSFCCTSAARSQSSRVWQGLV